MAKTNNQIWKNGTLWKIILLIVAAAMAWKALTMQVAQGEKQTETNTLAIAEEIQQRTADKLETNQYITELKKDVGYIIKSVDKQAQSLDDIKKEIRAIPVW